MLAALQGYGFRWPTGKDRLLLISIGTGRFQQTYQTKDIVDRPRPSRASRRCNRFWTIATG